ncbi:tryptophanyl-tRNA ligase II [Klebsiella pneumoniae RYC492]|nr:tryptophanyl-tRNA ligase II [Klebsiella pneumoniae RYC492]
MNHPQTILTGDRPTGQLHLGHYVGSLRQRVALQHNHQQFILIADLQGLTDNGSNPQKISHHILEVMADYLAVGIDPRLTTICLQSALPALAELSALYMNIVTVARVERNPTVKNEIAQKGFARSLPVGFLAYPISQAADITAFKAELVPVGDDQLPMIEQTNEIVHKMNSLTGEPVLRHCKALLSEVSRLPGVDGNAKMSKSLGNTLTLSATEEEIHHAVSAMYTDPTHLRVSDPGHVEGNVVFTYLDAFHSDKALVAEMKAHYQRGGLGDRQCKNELETCLQALLAPIRERRATYIQDKGMLLELLRQGSERAHQLTQQTLHEVKRGLGCRCCSEISVNAPTRPCTSYGQHRHECYYRDDGSSHYACFIKARIADDDHISSPAIGCASTRQSAASAALPPLFRPSQEGRSARRRKHAHHSAQGIKRVAYGQNKETLGRVFCRLTGGARRRRMVAAAPAGTPGGVCQQQRPNRSHRSRYCQ